MNKGSPVVLATGNAGKVREFNRLLAGAFEVCPLPPGTHLPPETGSTFTANARIKAEAVFRALRGAQAVLADDSGLEVAALAGRPGILSARFAGDGASDADNVAKLLAELTGVSDRSARFVCALCLVVRGEPTGAGTAAGGQASPAARAQALASGGACGESVGVTAPPARLIEVVGVTEGTITLAPRGSDGFGYDPVFQPEGWGLTLAEASPADKDRVSHRGAAVRALLACLPRQGKL